MRKHFFSAKNIEDYRKVYVKFIAQEKKPDESPEDFEQRFFLEYIKRLLKLPTNEVFDSVIYGETGIDGLRLDFNFGLRLDVPAGNFRVVIGDAETGAIFFDEHISDVRLISVEQYFIRWRVEIFLNDEKVFEHRLNLEGQTVMLASDGGMGDMIALLPFAREFQKRHRCRLSIHLPEYLREFAANLYPDFPQVAAINFKTYATYYLIMPIAPIRTIVADTRNMPMERMGGAVLGLETLPPKPTFKPTLPPVTREPYVCIAVQASLPRKGWHYPGGWKIVVDYLKILGYRVFCIDKKKFQSEEHYSISAPANAEDFTGDFSIPERANMLYHAEFFIGLSSGLAWVAEFVGCPVVMIAGFTQDWHEFYTPYRVANRLVCNGCFNDTRVFFNQNPCPYHRDTSRELECQKKIHPRQVINAIERLILDKNLTPPIARS